VIQDTQHTQAEAGPEIRLNRPVCVANTVEIVSGDGVAAIAGPSRLVPMHAVSRVAVAVGVRVVVVVVVVVFMRVAVLVVVMVDVVVIVLVV
jgi:hypothetical protein